MKHEEHLPRLPKSPEIAFDALAYQLPELPHLVLPVARQAIEALARFSGGPLIAYGDAPPFDGKGSEADAWNDEEYSVPEFVRLWRLSENQAVLVDRLMSTDSGWVLLDTAADIERLQAVLDDIISFGYDANQIRLRELMSHARLLTISSNDGDYLVACLRDSRCSSSEEAVNHPAFAGVDRAFVVQRELGIAWKPFHGEAG